MGSSFIFILIALFVALSGLGGSSLNLTNLLLSLIKTK
jgi:hypothetical protein